MGSLKNILFSKNVKVFALSGGWGGGGGEM